MILTLRCDLMDLIHIQLTLLCSKDILFVLSPESKLQTGLCIEKTLLNSEY